MEVFEVALVMMERTSISLLYMENQGLISQVLFVQHLHKMQQINHRKPMEVLGVRPIVPDRKNFSIVGISLDRVKNSWLNAVRKEQLPRTQLIIEDIEMEKNKLYT